MGRCLMKQEALLKRAARSYSAAVDAWNASAGSENWISRAAYDRVKDERERLDRAARAFVRAEQQEDRHNAAPNP